MAGAHLESSAPAALVSPALERLDEVAAALVVVARQLGAR